MIRAAVDAFRVPKAGNADEEYEDAFATYPEPHGDGVRLLSLAVADGATDSIFSGLWAKTLVNHFVEKPFQFYRMPKVILSELGAQWRSAVNSGECPWYVEHKLLQGSSAALTGVTLFPNNRWMALSVGDCCLFQVRESSVVRFYPTMHASDFNNSPVLISTEMRNNHCFLHPRVSRERGRWLDGDVFFLMSDALAKWFLEWGEAQEESRVVDDLNAIKDQEDFFRFVQGCREADVCRMRNDDVTFVRCQLYPKVDELA